MIKTLFRNDFRGMCQNVYNALILLVEARFAHPPIDHFSFDTFTFAVLNITIKYKCIFEKKSCSELTLTLVLNDYRLNQTATLLIGEPSQLEL